MRLAHATSLTPTLPALMILRSSGRHVVRQRSHRVVEMHRERPAGEDTARA